MARPPRNAPSIRMKLVTLPSLPRIVKRKAGEGLNYFQEVATSALALTPRRRAGSLNSFGNFSRFLIIVIILALGYALAGWARFDWAVNHGA
jgi:hypothetical protein